MDAKFGPLPSLKGLLARKANGLKDLASPYLHATNTRRRRRETKRSVENSQPGSGVGYRDSSVSYTSQSIGTLEAPFASLSRSRNTSKHQFLEKVDVEDLLSSTYRSQAQLRKSTSFYNKLRIDAQGCFKQTDTETSRLTLQVPTALSKQCNTLSLSKVRKAPRKTAVRKLNVKLTDLSRKNSFRKRL